MTLKKRIKIIKDKHISVLNFLLRYGAPENLVERLCHELNRNKTTIYYVLRELKEIGLRDLETISPLYLPPHIDALKRRIEKQHDLKNEMAKIVIEKKLIKQGTSVFFDCGSSSYILAETLINSKGNLLDDSIILTNNPLVTHSFLREKRIKGLTIIGGELKRDSFSFCGPITENSLARHSFQTLVLGVDGISNNGMLWLDFGEEINQKQLMIKQTSDQVLILADGSKMVPALHKFINILEIAKKTKVNLITSLKRTVDYFEKAKDTIQHLDNLAKPNHNVHIFKSVL